MSTPHRQQPDQSGWVSLEEGIQFSHRWLVERTPRLHEALQRARDEEQRRAIVLRILHAAAESESETRAGAEEPGPAHEWAPVAERIDRRLTQGSDWPLLAAALSRAAAAGYDAEAKLPGLSAASPLPERHPARELQWRLIGDCKAAVPELPARQPVNPNPQSAPEPPPPPSVVRAAQRAGPDR